MWLGLKLQKIPDTRTRKKYWGVHIHAAFTLLFSKQLKEFKPHLNSLDEIDEPLMFSVGLVEKSSVSNVPRFVHRTFAEYLLADFIVTNMKDNKKKDSAFVKFLMKKIFTKKRLDHPVIAYFVNMHMQHNFKDNHPNELAHLNAFNLENITDKDACAASVSCCYNGFESTFDLMAHIIKYLTIKEKNELINEYFKPLPHMVVANTNSHSFLEKVLNFTKLKFGANFSYHVDKNYQFRGGLQIPNCTPLHVAAYTGKYNTVTFLLDDYKEEIRSIKYLLHVCVHQSASDSETVLEEKLSIIEALVQFNREWLDEELEGRTPLLQYKIHERVAKKLVELGANINALSTEGGTVLHTLMTMMRGYDKVSRRSFSDLLRWALDNGFSSSSVIARGDKFQALLIEAITIFRTVDDEVVRMFHDEAHADFNQQNIKGNSVLFYAIQFSDSLHFIQQILDYGANPNHVDNDGRNVVHMAFWFSPHYILCPSRALELLKMLKLKGFNGLNQKDNEGRTPYMFAIMSKATFDIEFIKFLQDENVDFNAQDNDGNTALFHALKHSYCHDIDFIEKILGFDAHLTHTNNHGSNAAHMVMQGYKNSTLTIKLLKLLKLNEFHGFNESNNFGRTPIMDAIENRNFLDNEFLKFLGDEGVDFTARDNDGNSVLFYVLKYSKDIVLMQKILQFETNLNHKNVVGENLGDLFVDWLEYDIEENLKLSTLKLLVSNGVNGFNQCISPAGDFLDVISAVENTHVSGTTIRLFFQTASKTTDINGDTILFHAIKHFKSKDLVSTILAQGVNINYQNKLERNAAHYVMKYLKHDSMQTLDILKLLKSNQFTGFDRKDIDGCTPLMTGIKFRGVVESKVLEFLSTERIDFNAQDHCGQSVLLYAIEYSRNYNFIKKILNFEANPNHKTKIGRNAAHVVLQAYQNTPTLAVKVLKLLKSKGFDGLDNGDNDGRTPIMPLIKLKFGGMVMHKLYQHLSEEGVDFNAQDIDGNNVLFYVIEFSRNLDFIQQILNMGANPNHINKFGQNAAHKVLLSYKNYPHRRGNQTSKVLKLLQSNGFQGFNQKENLKGDTPLKLAVDSCIPDQDVLNFLRKRTSQ